MQNAAMPKAITIRGVSDEVRDKLALRAARAGQSLQEHLRMELTRLAAGPSAEELMERVRERKAATGSRLAGADILRHRDEDRR